MILGVGTGFTAASANLPSGNPSRFQRGSTYVAHSCGSERTPGRVSQISKGHVLGETRPYSGSYDLTQLG